MVSSSYQIKDIADRSGFTAATLRYYEEIGLLPEPTRTPAGYRLYDDHTLDRLAFITRAKQLGHVSRCCTSASSLGGGVLPPASCSSS